MSDIVQRLISAAEDFPEIEENPSDLYCAASVEIQHLRARLAAAEADAERLDWLEECPYWVTVQTQPHGDFIHSAYTGPQRINFWQPAWFKRRAGTRVTPPCWLPLFYPVATALRVRAPPSRAPWPPLLLRDE